MHKLIRKSVMAGILSMLLSAASSAAFAMPEIMPLSEVMPGMSGTAYTVMDASGEMRSFQVDVVGINGTGRDDSKMIMARAYGPLIDETDGVLQGMSGSPVYIEDRLVGALSIVIKDTSRRNFFIMPIERMLPLWDMPDTKGKIQFPTIDLKKIAEEKAEQEMTEEEVEEADRLDIPSDAAVSAREKEKTQETAAGTEAEANLQGGKTASAAAVGAETASKEQQPKTQEEMAAFGFSGFHDAGLSFLNKKLAPFGLQGKYQTDFSATSPAGGTTYQADIGPGDAVGVALIYGDFYVGATGTVTAVDGNRLLAFGHPFMHNGNVNYLMTDASVIGSVQSELTGMKIANGGNIIGRINQDRASGVAGIVGTFPEVVPMRVTVKDTALNRDESYGVRIAYNENMLTSLSAAVLYAAINNTSDTQDESTATVKFSIRTDAANGGILKRTNMFYSPTDVGQVAILEMAEMLNVICTNTDAASSILDMQFDVTVDSGRNTASLVSAVPDKMTAKPGETVNFKTTIKPYRREKEVLMIPYTVPKTQKKGTMNLDLRGGGFIPVNQMAMMQAADMEKTQTTRDKLQNLLALGKNNEIIIAPGAVTEVMSEAEQKKAIREAVEASKRQAEEHHVNLLGAAPAEGQSPEKKFETNYIIDNVIHATLQIEND